MRWDDPNRYDVLIARALLTPGGHLAIGRGGFTLHYDNARFRVLLQLCDADLVG